jgi:putative membrane protein insertion efficiency factor
MPAPVADIGSMLRQTEREPGGVGGLRPARILGRVAAVPAFAARGLITVYRYTLSSLVGRTCRHLPTCSEYADLAIGRFGLWRGGWLAAGRFFRCRPGGTHGFDPVPEILPGDARWYRPWRYGNWRSVLAD